MVMLLLETHHVYMLMVDYMQQGGYCSKIVMVIGVVVMADVVVSIEGCWGAYVVADWKVVGVDRYDVDCMVLLSSL